MRPKVIAWVIQSWDGLSWQPGESAETHATASLVKHAQNLNAEADSVLVCDSSRRGGMKWSAAVGKLRRFVWNNANPLQPISTLQPASHTKTGRELQETILHAEAGAETAPERVLEQLFAEFNVRKLLLDLDAKLLRIFLEQKCIDEICVYSAPVIRGGSALEPSSSWFPSSVPLSLLNVAQIGGGCFSRWRVKNRTKVSVNV